MARCRFRLFSGLLSRWRYGKTGDYPLPAAACQRSDEILWIHIHGPAHSVAFCMLLHPVYRLLQAMVQQVSLRVLEQQL